MRITFKDSADELDRARSLFTRVESALGFVQLQAVQTVVDDSHGIVQRRQHRRRHAHGSLTGATSVSVTQKRGRLVSQGLERSRRESPPGLPIDAWRRTGPRADC